MELSRRFKPLFLTVLLAFLCQSFVPAGFMPDFKTGKTALVICSGMDSKTIYIDDHKQDGKSHSAKPCSYALNAVGLLPPFVFIIVASDMFGHIVTALFRQYNLQHNIYVHAQSRAPPEKSLV